MGPKKNKTLPSQGDRTPRDRREGGIVPASLPSLSNDGPPGGSGASPPGESAIAAEEKKGERQRMTGMELGSGSDSSAGTKRRKRNWAEIIQSREKALAAWPEEDLHNFPGLLDSRIQELSPQRMFERAGYYLYECLACGEYGGNDADSEREWRNDDDERQVQAHIVDEVVYTLTGRVEELELELRKKEQKLSKTINKMEEKWKGAVERMKKAEKRMKEMEESKRDETSMEVEGVGTEKREMSTQTAPLSSSMGGGVRGAAVDSRLEKLGRKLEALTREVRSLAKGSGGGPLTGVAGGGERLSREGGFRPAPSPPGG